MYSPPRHLLVVLGLFCFTLHIHSQVVRSGKSSIVLDQEARPVVDDNMAPVPTFISPELKTNSSLLVGESEISLIGRIEDKSGIKDLFINNRSVIPDISHVFKTTLFLNEGDNLISLIAIDSAGNYFKETYIIKYDPYFSSVDESNQAGGKYYALIIGVDEYVDQEIIDLDNPIRDATRLKETLEAYYTYEPENIKLKLNAKREDIILALDEFAEIITPNDNFLLFYAGHGYWDEKSNIGYWLPADAMKGNKTNWFRNSTLCDYLKAIDSRHTLVIADACFGGAIFKTRKAFSDAPKAVKLLYDLPSRKAMTSGTLTEVPDQSSFIKYLILHLEQNEQKYLSSEQLFSSFRIAVINNSDAIPQYGEIKNVGDQGGDFIFIRK